MTEAPVEPDIAWFEFPFHDLLQADAREGLEAVIEALGPRVERLPVSDTLAGLVNVHLTIHEYEFCQHLAPEISKHFDQFSDTVKPAIARGQAISKTEYEDALAVRDSAIAFFDKHFNDFDAILAPSATGEPPLLSDGTGDPVYCRMASLAGLPAITLPILLGERGLPIGVQVVGGLEEDDRLMRTAAWMQTALAQET